MNIACQNKFILVLKKFNNFPIDWSAARSKHPSVDCKFKYQSGQQV